MPQLQFSQALTANQRDFDPLSSWQFRQNPYALALCRLFINATTVGVRVSAFSANVTAVQESPVQGGGTAGVIPNPLGTAPFEWYAAQGDMQSLNIDEVLGGTPTVNGYIEITPVA